MGHGDIPGSRIRAGIQGRVVAAEGAKQSLGACRRVWHRGLWHRGCIHGCCVCTTAVMDITDITKGKCESDEDKQHFIPVHL